MRRQGTEALGTRTGLISTSGVDTGGGIAPNQIHVTTPPAPLTHRLLAEMAAADLDAAVVEASSQSMWARHVFGKHGGVNRCRRERWNSSAYEQPQTVS